MNRVTDRMKTVLMKEVADDCRFFLGDRPCVWHKREGVVCTCERYQPIRERVPKHPHGAPAPPRRIAAASASAKTAISNAAASLAPRTSMATAIARTVSATIAPPHKAARTRGHRIP